MVPEKAITLQDTSFLSSNNHVKRDNVIKLFVRNLIWLIAEIKE